VLCLVTRPKSWVIHSSIVQATPYSGLLATSYLRSEAGQDVNAGDGLVRLAGYA